MKYLPINLFGIYSNELTGYLIYLSIYISIHLSTHSSINLSPSYLSIPSIFFIYLPTYLSVYLINLSIHRARMMFESYLGDELFRDMPSHPTNLWASEEAASESLEVINVRMYIYIYVYMYICDACISIYIFKLPIH